MLEESRPEALWLHAGPSVACAAGPAWVLWTMRPPAPPPLHPRAFDCTSCTFCLETTLTKMISLKKHVIIPDAVKLGHGEGVCVSFNWSWKGCSGTRPEAAPPLQPGQPPACAPSGPPLASLAQNHVYVLCKTIASSSLEKESNLNVHINAWL